MGWYVIKSDALQVSISPRLVYLAPRFLIVSEKVMPSLKVSRVRTMRASNFHWSNWMTWFFGLALLPICNVVRMAFVDLRQYWDDPEGMGWALLAYAPASLLLLFFLNFYWALSISYELAEDQITERRLFFKNRIFDLRKITRWEAQGYAGFQPQHLSSATTEGCQSRQSADPIDS